MSHHLEKYPEGIWMKKAVQTDSDFQLILLDWRNSPTKGMHSSPAQRMFGRRTRTLLPTSRELLKRTLITDVREKKLGRKKIQTRNYDRNAKELASLAEGDMVRMKPQAVDRKGRWTSTKARVEEQVNREPRTSTGCRTFSSSKRIIPFSMKKLSCKC